MKMPNKLEPIIIPDNYKCTQIKIVDKAFITIIVLILSIVLVKEDTEFFYTSFLLAFATYYSVCRATLTTRGLWKYLNTSIIANRKIALNILYFTLFGQLVIVAYKLVTFDNSGEHYLSIFGNLSIIVAHLMGYFIGHCTASGVYNQCLTYNRIYKVQDKNIGNFVGENTKFNIVEGNATIEYCKKNKTFYPTQFHT